MRSEPAKVTAVHTVRTGNTPMKEDKGVSRPMRAAADKWKDSQEDVRDLPWSAVPGEMMRDFVRAAAGELVNLYGENAEDKATEVLAGCLGGLDGESFQFSSSWGATGASFAMEVSKVPEPFGPSAPETSFEIEVAGDATEAEVREALGKWGEHPSVVTRLDFNPLDQLPADEMRTLMKQAEAVTGDQSNGDNQRDALLVTAALLMVWGKLERRNAATAEFVLSGLTRGDEEVCPGQAVKMNARRAGMETSHTPMDPQDNGPVTRATVRMRPS
jgi:hypothetical protein